MNQQIHEDIRIDKAGVEEILKLHVERIEKIERDKTRVIFDIKTRTTGYGYSEVDESVFVGAKVETTTPTVDADILKILGRRTFIFNEAETKEAIEEYIAEARKIDVSEIIVEILLQQRHQGDRGGWEGPSITGAKATIQIA